LEGTATKKEKDASPRELLFENNCEKLLCQIIEKDASPNALLFENNCEKLLCQNT